MRAEGESERDDECEPSVEAARVVDRLLGPIRGVSARRGSAERGPYVPGPSEQSSSREELLLQEQRALTQELGRLRTAEAPASGTVRVSADGAPV
ncbi:MAG: hypothetical protein AAF411_17835, partial [Myxococcota bacterium]